MHYRSNWAELGLDGPLSVAELPLDSAGWQSAKNSQWRWVGKQDNFESRLYGIPIWTIHLEISNAGEEWLTQGPGTDQLYHTLKKSLEQFLRGVTESTAYVTIKAVRDEPLYQLLCDAGFEPVERRCLYKSTVGKLRTCLGEANSSVQYQSMAAIPTKLHDEIRQRILEVCNESFQQAYGRHYCDEFLLQRATGLSYMQNAIAQNFERVPLHYTLLASEVVSGDLCGFSFLSRRPGLDKPFYTQLLSAVSKRCRGKQIYAGLTHLLSSIVSGESQLISVTHEENQSMRNAYLKMGRIHYADTVVLRRVLGSAAQSTSALTMNR